MAIALFALGFRILQLGLWISGDEANFWLARSATFLNAITTGRFAATAISTHPGVTTMWLGSAGLLLQDWLADSGWISDFRFAAYLGWVRLPMALVHTLGVVLGYALLRRMLPPLTAALAALLWATDPFTIAFSRTLHVDALPATFLTLSLLAGCLYWNHEARRRWLLLSAICGGLAILSKSPALIIAPLIGLTWFLADSARQRFSWAALRSLLAWGLVCGLTIFIGWPVLWVDPLAAYDLLRLGVEAEGAEPHMLGNFFLGQQDDAPGWLFYPVALALRLTPWAMLGLLILAISWWYQRPSTGSPAQSPERLSAATWRTLAILLVFVLLFLAAMSLFPKKFNRYIVPTFPALLILAAVGLAWLVDLAYRLQRWLRPILAGSIALLAIGNAAWFHPYPIVYFNQLLGGPQAGAATFTTGWGEGLNLVADWLNQQPNIRNVITTTTLSAPLRPYMQRGAQADRPRAGQLPTDAGYVVVYVRNIQWGPIDPPFDQFYRQRTPLHTVTIHGVDYAWIYQAPPPLARPRPAAFGPALRLRGYNQLNSPQPATNLDLQLHWETSATLPTNYRLFAHLIDENGTRRAQIDPDYPTSQWNPAEYQITSLQFPLPANLAPGTYRLLVGVYDPATNQRLPLHIATATDPKLSGPDALELLTVTIR